MSDKILKSNIKKTNFFDGQRVSESDLDSNQKYFESLISSNNLDFHSSGILKKNLNDKILLDTAVPGFHSISGYDNPSIGIINSGSYDGVPLKVDAQPSDKIYGSRLEVELKESEARGREQNAYVLIVGLCYDPQYKEGILDYEVLIYDDNKTLLTENHYFDIKCIILNNISKGSGFTDSQKIKKSLNLGGRVIIRESGSVKIFAKSNNFRNNASPNFDLSKMFGESSLSEEIETGISPTNSIDELFINYDYELKSFSPLDPIGISYGQKFVCSSNNIQKIEVLMSVDRDLSSELNWQGDLTFSLYELEPPSDRRGLSPIDGNPKISPIAEVSLDQEDLLQNGFSLKEGLSKIFIDFSSSKISDPKSGIIKPGKGYAFMISRAGNNSFGKINVCVGGNYIYTKKQSTSNLKIKEVYETISYEFIEFDPNYSSYIVDEEKSLWFEVHSSQFEITSGLIYDTEGRVFSVPELEDYVAETKINYKMDPIDLASVTKKNIICISGSNDFSSPDVHPRTGNFVYTRICSSPQVLVYEEDDVTYDENSCVLIGTIDDTTPRNPEVLSIVLDKPGLIDRDFFYIVNPSAKILSKNLLGRKFSVDEKFSFEYMINKVETLNLKYGDIDNSNLFSSYDLNHILSISGNTITSTETQRAILGGSIDIIDYIKSDLNGDGIIDGEDISLMEDAINGRVNFPAGEILTVLKVSFESEVTKELPPEIGAYGPISTAQADTSITITSVDRNIALIIDIGDKVQFTSGVNSGDFYISSKTVQADGTTVVLGLEDESGDTAILGSENQNILKIISKNITNALLDNTSIVETPFSLFDSKVYFNDYFQERNIDICDLRSFLDFSFKEDVNESCLCEGEIHTCGIKKVNQKYLPGDLYIDGRVKTRDGKEYSSDYEYSNVSVDMPIGTLNGCQIDLYNSFIKSDGNSCYTEIGYPAMKFSDGTYVGCEDIADDTDLKKGRIKISGALASLHVDAFVDGYEVDNSEDETETSQAAEKISESGTNFVYTKFNTSGDTYWSRAGFSGKFSIVEPSNGPAEISLETHSTATETSAILGNPAEISSVSGLSGDFVYDFEVSRDTIQWEDYNLQNGTVEFYLKFTIDNGSNGSSILKLGYRVYGNETKIFYSGSILDSSGTETYSFNYEEETPEVAGEKIFFRLRRVNDAVYAYSLNPNVYDPDKNPSQEFVRIGQNLLVQPGSGNGLSEFVISNSSGISTGKTFKIKLYSVDIFSSVSFSDASSNILFSRNFLTDVTTRNLITFPLPFSSSVKVTSAKLKMISASSKTLDARVLVTPIINLNLENLGLFYNLSKTIESTVYETEHIGAITSGSEISIDILSLIRHFQSNSGHIANQKKGVIVELDPSALSTGEKIFEVENNITVEYTYEDFTTGVVFQIGVDVDQATGIATFKTKNILYDIGDKAKRTRVNFGVHLKKSGFKNKDLDIRVTDLQKIKYGIGACIDESALIKEDGTSDCYFISGDSSTGTFVQGPFPCNFYSGNAVGASSTVEMSITRSGSKINFDGNLNPELNLTEEVTYVFDVSDSSMSGTKISFRDLSGNKITSGFSVSGVPGTVLAEIIFTVPKSSGTLEYYDDAGIITDKGFVYTPASV